VNRIDKMTDKMPIRAGAKSLMMQSKSDGRERSRKPLPSGFGHHALRYYGRGGRCCPCTGLASRRVTPSARTSQEAWPGAESGGQSPGESRSGAPEGERAPQAEALRKQRILWRASAPNANKRRSLRPLVCTADNGWIASFGAPLPSLFFARAAEFLNWLGGGKARTRSRRENAFYFLPR
jgi:hypothetical protein